MQGDGQKVVGLAYDHRATAESAFSPWTASSCRSACCRITGWLKGTLELTPHGEVVVDSHARTSMPGVFAAGDCTITPYKQIVIALGEGAKASLAAFDHLIRTSAPNEEGQSRLSRSR